MIAEMQKVYNRMCHAYRHGSSLVLLFDYDGTLTPIVDHPNLAVLDRETKRLLADLTLRPRVYLGILSGRTLDELASLVQLPKVYLAGTGGMELDLRGLRIAHPHANRIADAMSRLAGCLEATIADYQGAWLEKKRLGLTIHYRHLPERLHGALHAVVTDTITESANDVRVLRGPKALEITPTNGWNKGMATRLILADIGAANDILFYAGDGDNDSEAVEEVAAMGGITVGIGPNLPAAAYRLPSHVALLSFLDKLNSSLTKRKPHFTRSAEKCSGLLRFIKPTIPTT